MQTLFIVIVSLLFGVFQKIADALDEHGLKIFRGADIIFGIIWGVLGALLVYSDIHLASWFAGLVLYWIARGKIDYPNHMLSILIIAGTYVVTYRFFFDYWALFVFIFLWLASLILMMLGVKHKAYIMLIVPFIYSLLIDNFIPFVSVLATVLSIEGTKSFLRSKGIKT